MVEIAGRHPKLNLLNLEAVAAARTLSATIWLSAEGALGLLADVLEAEGLDWRSVRRPEEAAMRRAVGPVGGCLVEG